MATDRTVTGAGFKLVIASGSVSKKAQAAILDGLKDVAKNYKEQIDKVISLDDHTLEELRALGHPYSTSLPAGNLHGDDRLVHDQTGKLRSSIKVTAPQATTTRTFSVFVSSTSEHMKYLIFGTSRMRPRRFHEIAYDKIKDRFWNPVLDKLKKVEHRIQITERIGK